MVEISHKPYLIRAIYEWCADAGYTPYLSVRVDEHVRVPLEYVKNGEIVLSVSQQATRNLTIGNDVVQFSARFNGVSREISVPLYAVQSIFARENGRGMSFDAEPPPPEFSTAEKVPQSAPTLQAVPAIASVISIGTSNPSPGPQANSAQAVTPVDGETTDQPSPPDKPRAPPRGNLRIIK